MNFYGITFEQILQYINIGILALLGLGALFGFMRGFSKSFYKFIVLFGMLILGWFLLEPISNKILEFDLKSIYPMNVEGIEVTSIKETLPLLISKYAPMFGSIDPNDSYTYNLIFELLIMILKFVVLIVWFILMITLFKFVFFIIWLIIRPKKRDANGKKKKKSLGSRFAGAPFGLGRVFIILLVFFIPIAGLSTIGSAIGNVNIEETPSNISYKYRAIIEEDGSINLNVNENMSSYSEALEMIKEISNAYRNTITGKIVEKIKINNKPLDETLFDNVLSFKANGEVITLREELLTVCDIYKTVMEETSGAITAESLTSLSQEAIESVSSKIASLKIIKVAIPVAVEVVVESDLLSSISQEYSTAIDINAILENVEKIDIANDITYIGKAAGDVISLGILNFEDDIAFDANTILSLEAEKVESLFNNLSKITLIDCVAPIASGLLLDSEFIGNVCDEYEISREKIDFTEVVWSNEVKNLGQIFKGFKALDIKGFTLEDFKEANLNDDSISFFTTSLFNSKVISNAVDVLAIIVLDNVFTEESGLSSFINKDELMKITWNKDEFDSLLSLGAFAINSGLVDKNEEGEIDIFANLKSILTNEKIDELNKYLLKSELIKTSLTSVLGSLIENESLPFKLDLTMIKEEGYWDNHPKEIAYILRILKVLLDSNLLDGESGNNDAIMNFLGKLSDDEVIDNIILSDILSHTFVSLLTNAPIVELSSDNYVIIDGVASTYKVEGDINSLKIEVKDKYVYINNENTNIIHESMLDDVTSLIVVPSSYVGKSNYIKWNNDGSGELRNILKAIALVLSNVDLNNIDMIIDSFFNLRNDEIEIIESSIVIRATLLKQLFDYTFNDENELLYVRDEMVPTLEELGDVAGLSTSDINKKIAEIVAVDSKYGWIGPKGEISTLLNSVKIFLGLEEVKEIKQTVTIAVDSINETVPYGTKKILVANDVEEKVFKYWVRNGILFSKNKQIEFTADDDYIFEKVYCQSDEVIVTFVDSQKKILKREVLLKNQNATAPLPEKEGYTFKEWNKDFTNVQNDIEVVAIYNETLIDRLKDIDVNVLLDKVKANEIMKSKLLTTTIVGTLLRELSTNEIVCIPAIYKDYNYMGWYDNGELSRIIDSLGVILGSNIDVKNINIDINSVLDLESEDIAIIESSDIICATVICELFKLNNAEDRFIYINDELTMSCLSYLVLQDAASDEALKENSPWRGENGEIRKMLSSVSTLLEGEELGENPLENLNSINLNKLLSEETLAKVLESNVLETTIVGVVIKSIKDNELIVIPSLYLDFNYEKWYKNEENDGELRKLLKTLNIVIGDNDVKIDNINVELGTLLNLSSEDISTLESSDIISATIVSELLKLNEGTDRKIYIRESLVASTGTTKERAASLVMMPNSSLRGNDGEINKLLSSISYLFEENSELDNPFESLSNIKIDKVLNEETQNKVLKSNILETTITGTIIKSLENNDIVIMPSVYLNYEDDSWFENGVNIGELRKLLRTLNIILDGENVDINNFDIDLGKFTKLDNSQINTIESSDIISATVISELLKLNEGEERTIYIKEDLISSSGTIKERAAYLAMKDDSLLRGNNGELQKMLSSITFLFSNNENLENPFESLSSIKVSKLLEDESQNEILKSNILETTIIGTIIKALKNNDIVVLPTAYLNYENDSWFKVGANDGELRKLLKALRVVLGGGDVDFNNIDVDIESLTTLSEDDIFYVESSDIISATIIKQILELDKSYSAANSIYIDSNLRTNIGTSKEEAINLSMDENYGWRGESGEISSLLRAISAIFTEKSASVSIEIMEKINEDPSYNSLIDKVQVDSKHFEFTSLEKEGYDFLYWIKDGKYYSDSNKIKVNKLDYGTYTACYKDIDKHVATFIGYDNTILRKVYTNNNDILKIESSKITVNEVIVLDAPDTSRSGFTFKKWDKDVASGITMNSNVLIKALYNESPFSNVTNVKLGLLTSANLSREVILGSKIIFNTIKENIINSGSSIIVTSSVSSWDKLASYIAPNTGTIEMKENAGELRNFLDAVVLAIGGDEATISNLSGVNFSFNNLYENIDNILISNIFEESIIKKIKDYANDGGSILSLPTVDEEDEMARFYYSYYKNKGDGIGEVRRFINAIKVITGGNDLENLTTNADDLVNMFFDENRDDLLDSRIIEATIIKQVMLLNNALIIPSGASFEYLASEPLVFEKTNGVSQSSKGELRRLLDAFSVIKGENNIGDLAFGWSNIQNMSAQDFYILTSSRVLEATLSKTIEDDILANNTNFIKEPEDGYKWYRDANLDKVYVDAAQTTNLEFGDLLPLLIAITKMENCGLIGTNLTAESIVHAANEPDMANALWYSRVIRLSLPKMMNFVIFNTLYQVPFVGGANTLGTITSAGIIDNNPARTNEAPFIIEDFNTIEKLQAVLNYISTISAFLS